MALCRLVSCAGLIGGCSATACGNNGQYYIAGGLPTPPFADAHVHVTPNDNWQSRCDECKASLERQNRIPHDCYCEEWTLQGVFLTCNSPLCDEGQYASGGSCVPCPTGLTTAAAGATSQSQCVEAPCPDNKWKDLNGECQTCECGAGEASIGCPGDCPDQRHAQQPGRCFQVPCYYTPRLSIMMCPRSASEPCFWSESSTQTNVQETQSSTTYSASVSGEVSTTLKAAAMNSIMSDPEVTGTAEGGVEHTDTRVYRDIDSSTGRRVIGLRPGSQFCPEIREVTMSSDGQHTQCSNFMAFEGALDLGVTVGCDVQADNEHFNHGTWCPEDIGESCFGGSGPLSNSDCELTSMASRTQMLTMVWVVLFAIQAVGRN